MAYLEVMQNGIIDYLKHPFLLCQNNYGHYLSLSSYLVNLQNPWICGYKEVMGEDISQNFPLAHTMCSAEKQTYVINEVLLLLQEEIEGMGSSFEVFGLQVPTWNFAFRGYQKQSQKKCFVLNTKQILVKEI